MLNITRKLFFISLFFASIFLFPLPTFAHVIVKPSTAPIASEQTFDMSIPSETDASTVGVKLIIPEGLTNVIPNVKPGWNITVIKNGDTVTEIDWTDGNIPAGQKDDFYFSAQVPATTKTLIWKAYQTYDDGSTTNWDANPTTIKAGQEGTPYSTTQIVNDLAAATAAKKAEEHTSQKIDLAIILSVIGIGISCIALSIARKKNVIPSVTPTKTKRIRKRRI